MYKLTGMWRWPTILLLPVVPLLALANHCRPGNAQGDSAPSSSVEQLAISSATAAVASLHVDGALVLQNLNSGDELRLVTCLAEGGKALTFSADGKLLALGTDAGVLTVWSVDSGREMASIKAADSEIESVDISPDNEYVGAVSRNGQIRVWKVATGAAELSFEANLKEPSSISFSPDGRWFASATNKGICVWSLAAHSIEQCFATKAPWINGVIFSGDSRTLAASGSNGNIYLWDLANRKAVKKLHVDGEATILSFVTGTDALISLTEGGEVAVWDVTTGRVKRKWTLGEGVVPALSREGSLCARGSLWDGKIQVLKAATGEPLATLDYNSEMVTTDSSPAH